MRLFHSPDLEQIDFLDERFYKISEGVYYPSVTTILSAFPKNEFFYTWLKENGETADQILREAGDSGSKVHAATEEYDNGFEVTWADEKGVAKFTLQEWQLFLKYVDFSNLVKPNIVGREIKVFSHIHQFAGTIDLVCVIDDDLWVLDIKTSNGFYPTFHLQTAAYAVALNEMFPEFTARTGVLWLKAKTRGTDKSGKKLQGQGWQIVESENKVQTDFDVFKNVQAVYKIANPNSKPYNLVLPDRVRLPKERIQLRKI